MTDGKSIIKKIKKTNAHTRQTAFMDANERLKAIATINPLPKEPISEALRSVLENRDHINKAMKIASGRHTQLQNSIDAALVPSKAIKVAMETIVMPSGLPTVSIPKMRSIPTASGISTPLISREKRSDLHLLQNIADLGKAVRNARKVKGLTQQNFSDLAGVGRRFVSELEQGKQTLKIGKVIKVVSAAGIQLMFTSPDTNP